MGKAAKLRSAFSDLPPATLLVVDDSQAMLDLLREQLWTFGFKVRLAHSGEEALQQARLQHPDLILLDVMMPGIDGFETCRRLKDDAETEAIPVIFMTSLDHIEDKLAGFEAGGVDYVTKPIEISEVVARIATQLAAQAAHRSLQAEAAAHWATAQTLREREQLLIQRTEEARHALDQLLRGEKLAVQDKLAAIGLLSTGVAHEINNPTHIALASTEDLQRQLTEFRHFLLELAGPEADRDVLAAIEQRLDRLQQPLRDIVESGRRIATIIQDLRQFARHQDTPVASARPLDALRATLKLIEVRYRHDIQFDVELAVDPELPCRPDRLNQVFMNLLVNACHAVRARAEQADPGFLGRVVLRSRQGGNELLVEVEDNGIGMDQAVIGHLFEPFFTTKPAGVGTGLGLAVSRSIVEEHGGRFDVRSTPGEGSCFTVRLPLGDGA